MQKNAAELFFFLQNKVSLSFRQKKFVFVFAKIRKVSQFLNERRNKTGSFIFSNSKLMVAVDLRVKLDKAVCLISLTRLTVW